MADRVPARPPTILDVARRAKVSKSTVSNVVRGVACVTAPTRAKVLRAIDALGYRPNVLARQLVQQRTMILGVVAGDLSNPFHAEMAQQVERHAAMHGYRTMFCSTQSHEEAELSGLEGLLEHRVAGIVFLAHAADSARVHRLVDGRVPVVFASCSADWGDVVCADDAHGATLATRHLIELGHQRIAYFADPLVEDVADRARQLGYRRAMRRAGLATAVYHWQRTPEKVLRNGAEVALHDVLSGAQRFTAVFSSNDLGAIELLDEADRLGVPVPGELSIVGFDDVLLAGLARINLTTVAQPKELLARLAVEMLAARLDGTLTGEPVRQTVKVELVKRGSTAAPGLQQRKAG
jgi:LacI family transcriptional regulator